VAGTAARSPALREELPDARSLVSGEVVHHHVQSPSCPPVGCEPLLREALRQDHSRGRLPHPEEESWTTSEDRRELDEKARRLLEEDVKRRPAATVAQRGAAFWSTSRVLASATRPSGGFWGAWALAEKKDREGHRTGRPLERRLAIDGCRKSGRRAPCARRRDGHQHFAFYPVCLRASRARGRAALYHRRGRNTTFFGA
jgi:hypothetical protein